jgi:AcrR family transcriptional regulator
VTPATRTRLTREESRAVTRRRLLDAAADLFLRQGFEGASLDEIAEAAGYTRGALYSNFDGKDDLFLTLMREHLDEERAGAERAFDSGATPEDRIRAVEAWHEKHMDRESRWDAVMLEFWLYATRNPRLRPKLAAMQQGLREAIARMVERQLTDLGIPAPIPADDLASIVIALDCGIGAQRSMDPRSVPGDLFGKALMLLTVGLAASAPTTKRRRP